jgi:hypothetical protein
LDQWRRLGRWPTSYDRFWAGLMERRGQQAGTKEMIGLLQLGRRHGQERLRAAIEEALALGCRDAAAVQHLMTTRQLERKQPAVLDIGPLVAFERPLPQVNEYDQLLAGGVR